MKTYRLNLQSSEFPMLSMEFDMMGSIMARDYAIKLSKKIASPQYRHFELWENIAGDNPVMIGEWLVSIDEPAITEV
jgi:hypothetical protein